MLLRIHEHHTILVEEAFVAFDEYGEIAAVLEREPGTAIGENVRAHRRCSVQRGSHALPGIPIPGAFLFRDIDACRFPELELGDVRSAAIAARDERRSAILDLFQRSDDILRAADLR